jgi:hypothetical protein
LLEDKKMEYARKMAVVPIDDIPTLPAPRPQPYANAVSSLDREMVSLLQDSTLDPGERAQIYQQLLRRYLTFQRARPTDSPLPTPSPLHNPSPMASTFSPNPPFTFRGDDDVEKEIFHTVPRKFDETTNLLIERMKENRDILSWAPTGELIYKNKMIPNTNIVELVGDLVQPKKKTTLTGIDTIRQGLEEIDFPRDVLPKRPKTRTPTEAVEDGRGRSRLKASLRSQNRRTSTTPVRKGRNRWDPYV